MNGCTLLTWLMLKDSENKMNVACDTNMDSNFRIYMKRNNVIKRARFGSGFGCRCDSYRTVTPLYS